MDARALAASSQAFERTQTAARASVTHRRPDATQEPYGAYPAAATRTGLIAQPFYEDRNVVLSRPAHLRDYQADSAAYPFRTQRPEELAPYVPKAVPQPEMPKLVFTSEAEQKWLHDREQAARASELAAHAAEQVSRKDFSQAPPPFVSRLGFRQAAPIPPQPQPIKEFCHRDGVSHEFFWGGQGRFVSENGKSNSQKYFSLARPLGGRPRAHQTSITTPHGYHFEGPLSYTDRP